MQGEGDIMKTRTMNDIMNVIAHNEYFRVIFTFGVEMTVLDDGLDMTVNVTPHTPNEEEQGWYDYNYTTPSFIIRPSGRIDLRMEVDGEDLQLDDASLEDIRKYIRPVPNYEVWWPRDEKEKKEADMLTSYLANLARMWIDWNE